MSGYTSSSPYFLAHLGTFEERRRFVESFCKLEVNRGECLKYIEELEKEKVFLRGQQAHYENISNSIEQSRKLENTLAKARREEEMKETQAAKQAAKQAALKAKEHKKQEDANEILRNEFDMAAESSPKACESDDEGGCSIMGGTRRRRYKLRNRCKKSKKCRRSKRYRGKKSRRTRR